MRRCETVTGAPPTHAARVPGGVVTDVATVSSRSAQIVAYGAVVLLTIWSLAIRVGPLAGPDGALSTDEARLGLASDGVLATGLPFLPSGRLYLRGLLTTYAIAPSFALFGRHDWSARLPSAIAGALLVPLAFVFGRRLGGTAGGLAAALLVAVADPLVEWSQQAWPPSIFLLAFVAACYAAYRGFGEDAPRWQPVAAGLFGLALLAYEFALLLPLALGPYLLARLARGDRGWWQGRPTVAAAAIAALFGGMFVLFGLALRSGTLAGADAEFRHYLTPGIRLDGTRFYLRYVWGAYLPLLSVVALALPWTFGRDANGSGPRRAPGLILLLLGAAVVVPAFVIQRKWEAHYGLAALPLLGLAAAQAAGALGAFLRRRFDGRGRTARRDAAPGDGPGRGLALRVGPLLAVGALFAALAVAVRADVRDAFVPARPPASGVPWPGATDPPWEIELRALGWMPGDLVFAEGPLVTQFYLGAADFYVQPDGYERYARQDGSVVRSLYTNAVLLKEAGDFERLVARPYAGRVLWVVGKDDRLPRLTRQMDPAVWTFLQERSGVERPTRTGWWLMRVELPA